MKPCTIIIVDDHPIFLEPLQEWFSKQKDFLVIGIANSAENLLELLNHQIPEILILDIELPKVNGLELALNIREQFPHLKMILLSGVVNNLYVTKAIKAGINGYFHKSISPDELIDGLYQIQKGEILFPELQSKEKPIDNLSKREKEILKLLGKHMTNIDIANHLNLSVLTVDTHRKNIMQKLGFRRPGELMQYILENGFN